MRWFVPLTPLILFGLQGSALAQLGPSVPTGDFRVEGRPGTDPTVGPREDRVSRRDPPLFAIALAVDLPMKS